MSSETPYEMVDVIKEDGPTFQDDKSCRSYYPSQIPVESTSESTAREHVIDSSHRPTECTSGDVKALDVPKVEELADNLMVATRENEKFRKAMEDCNRALSKEIEAGESRKQELHNLKEMLEKYRVTNGELEERNKSLQDQLSARVSIACCMVKHLFVKGIQSAHCVYTIV